MDALEIAAVNRAQSALATVLQTSKIIDQKAEAAQRRAAFLHIARALVMHPQEAVALNVLARDSHPHLDAFTKAASVGVPAGFESPTGRDLADAYIQSIAEGDALSWLGRYGTSLSALYPAWIATGGTASLYGEGDVKVSKAFSLIPDAPEMSKVVAMIAVSAEFELWAGARLMALIDKYLSHQVLTTSNAAVLAALTDSNNATVSGTGDPVQDMRLALTAAVPSSGYVVIAPAGAVAAIVLSDANKLGAGLTGGELAPGIALVPGNVENIRVIAATGIIVVDKGLILAHSNEASLSLSDSPTSPSQMVSLFQVNATSLRAERYYAIAGSGANMVVVQ